MSVSKCQTCGGRGEIGGLLPGDGGYQTDPCPDCASAAENVACPKCGGHIPGGSELPSFSCRCASAVEEVKPPHSDDVAVDQFAVALKAKLAQARKKGRSGWDNKDPDTGGCTQSYLSYQMGHHMSKGDPLDVAAFAMFLHLRGESIT